MMKSKPFIICLAILGAIVGIWAGSNAANSGFAMMFLIGIVIVLGYLVYKSLGGNRRLEKLSDTERHRVLAEQPASARALVYREGFMAKLAGFDIAIDGVSYAQLKSPQSVAIDLAPGDHVLVVKAAGKNQPPLAFSVGAGEVVALRIGMGIAGCELSQEDVGQARSKLRTIPMVRPDGGAAGVGAPVSVGV